METNRKCTRIAGIFCWILSVLVWIFLIIFIVTFASKKSTTFLTPLAIFYIIYFILQLCSSTASYLCHKRTGKGMYERMGDFYMTPPEITFFCECFHYENHSYQTKNKNGGSTYHYKRLQVVTYKDLFQVPYYSARDVSGLFYLDCNEAYIKKKSYIQLELSEEINFADNISYYDYMFY